MARSKNLTMAGKKQVATLGVLAVVLILAKFFPMVYGNILNQTSRLAGGDPQRSSEIINGVILICLGLIWFMLAKVFSYAPFFKSAWNISGLALVGIGGLLIANQNPFNADNFDPSNYGA